MTIKDLVDDGGDFFIFKDVVIEFNVTLEVFFSVLVNIDDIIYGSVIDELIIVHPKAIERFVSDTEGYDLIFGEDTGTFFALEAVAIVTYVVFGIAFWACSLNELVEV